MPRIASLALALLAATAPALAAQQNAPDRFPPIRMTAPDLGPVAIDAHSHEPPIPAGIQGRDDRSGSILASLTRSVGAALVGGWVGFVGAQVARSDWDKSTNGEFSEQRTTWIAAGALLGLVSIRVVPGLGSRGPDRPGTPAAPRARTLISANEIQDANVLNALELVQGLRPEWLVVRGTQKWSETASGRGEDRTLAYTPGEATITVYMNGMRLGGVDAMADVPLTGLTSVEFLDAHRAAVRLGAGNTHGAIVLSTATAAP